MIVVPITELKKGRERLSILPDETIQPVGGRTEIETQEV